MSSALAKLQYNDKKVSWGSCLLKLKKSEWSFCVRPAEWKQLAMRGLCHTVQLAKESHFTSPIATRPCSLCSTEESTLTSMAAFYWAAQGSIAICVIEEISLGWIGGRDIVHVWLQRGKSYLKLLLIGPNYLLWQQWCVWVCVCVCDERLRCMFRVMRPAELKEPRLSRPLRYRTSNTAQWQIVVLFT